MSAVNVSILLSEPGLTAETWQRKQIWNWSCRGWPYLFFRHSEFAFSTSPPLDASCDSHVFEERSKPWAQRRSEPHLSAVVFTPGTFGILSSLWEPCWLWPLQNNELTFCAVPFEASRVPEMKTNRGGHRGGHRGGRRRRRWERVPPLPGLFSSSTLQKTGKCQVRTVGHVHEKSLRAAHLQLDIHWVEKNSGLRRQRGRHFIQYVPTDGFCTGRNAKG